ncbi:hypothetical protein AOL_s00006g32 [Orbilia oligospora ATCC 24927]|uniref:HTH APSES-type domain-containing protein n=1 Tax=Arthrobotrys oligospora (strain ATCC 24927 / CBS 115.81 / DSM 1491) TaxID=756982 RepID=G1WZI1_ARTOA|nr:hypothetical protein AOL_s00006g32 [Orbilia oligospora ATCC 24927]EGX53704.1 hypothetical protein AOL_s00006g32 [Orbilia oligospora ATCC 24927]
MVGGKGGEGEDEVVDSSFLFGNRNFSLPNSVYSSASSPFPHQRPPTTSNINTINTLDFDFDFDSTSKLQPQPNFHSTPNMTVKRRLPSRFNPLLTENDPSKDDLIELRRLGQTKLSTNTKPSAPAGSSPVPQQVLFSYVHLRAPLPQDINPEIFGGTATGTKPEAYFLMRRSKDGYVSSTGMFKASFPYATKQEEESERRIVKSRFQISSDETAGNAWISPDDALTLATEYRCRVWIEALLDDRPVNSDPRNKAITPPPPYRPNKNGVESLSPASAKTKTVARSVSPQPRKIAPMRKPRSARAVIANKESSLAPDTSEQPPASAPSSEDPNAPVLSNDEETTPVDDAAAVAETTSTMETSTGIVKIEDATEVDAVDPSSYVSSIVVKPELKDEAKVEVEATVEENGDVVLESTHVKVEIQSPSDDLSLLPDSADDIAKATEMVAEAIKEYNSELSASLSASKKRKIEDSFSQDIPRIETLEINSPKKSKRVRVMDVITEEGFQKRALLGLGATVALG